MKKGSFATREGQRQREVKVFREKPGFETMDNLARLRELSDRFHINGVPRLVQLAMSQGWGGKIKNLYKLAAEALGKKPDEQVLRPPQEQRGGAVATEGPSISRTPGGKVVEKKDARWQIDVGSMATFGDKDYSAFLIAVNLFDRFTRCEPIKSTKFEHVSAVFEGWKPNVSILDCDGAPEFNNKHFNEYCAAHDITIVRKHPHDLNALSSVDRKLQQCKNQLSGGITRTKKIGMSSCQESYMGLTSCLVKRC